MPWCAHVYVGNLLHELYARSLQLGADLDSHFNGTLCRGQSSEPSRTDSFIAHFKLHLELPCGVDLIAANTGSAATGMRTPVQGVYGLEFRVKVHISVLI